MLAVIFATILTQQPEIRPVSVQWSARQEHLARLRERTSTCLDALSEALQAKSFAELGPRVFAAMEAKGDVPSADADNPVSVASRNPEMVSAALDGEFEGALDRVLELCRPEAAPDFVLPK